MKSIRVHENQILIGKAQQEKVWMPNYATSFPARNLPFHSIMPFIPDSWQKLTERKEIPSQKCNKNTIDRVNKTTTFLTEYSLYWNLKVPVSAIEMKHDQQKQETSVFPVEVKTANSFLAYNWCYRPAQIVDETTE